MPEFSKIRDTSAWNPAGFRLEFSYGNLENIITTDENVITAGR